MMSQSTPADPAGLLGQMLEGRYRVLEFVGEGALGFVYRGEQAALRRACALKILRSAVGSDRARLQRFLDSGPPMMRRPGAVVLVDEVLTTTDPSAPARTTLVLPWQQGHDLAAELRQAHGCLPWARVRGLVLQIGETLSDLHAAGHACGGLKPSNVFLTRGRDGDPTVKLLDVGLSRHHAATATIAYMAPEWIAGAEPDARADLYNLAALTYEALTGVPAFDGPPAQVALIKRIKTPPPLRAIAPEISLPAEIEALLLRSLERDPQARPDLAGFLSVLAQAHDEADPGAAPEEGVTSFFRRPTSLPSHFSQSGELNDEEQPTTGQFKRSAAATAFASPAPAAAEVTRINTRPAPTSARAQVSAPPLPTEERTIVAPPRAAPLAETTRVALPPTSPAPAEATRVALLPVSSSSVEPAWTPAPRPLQSPASPTRVPVVTRRQNSEPRRAPAASDPALAERTQVLSPIADTTERLTHGERTSVLLIPGHSSSAPDTRALADQTSRTVQVRGFGGSVLVESEATHDAAMTTLPASRPPRRWALWDRIMRRFRRDAWTDRPQKPGLWMRLRGLKATNLPARRGPSGWTRLLRRLGEVPGYIGRGWRLALRPLGRLTGLRSRLTAPLLALRTAFGRLTRILSRWTGGGA